MKAVHLRGLAVSASCILLPGCNDLLGTACTTELVRNFQIEVRDSTTGAPAALGAEGFVTSGEYEGELRAVSELLLLETQWTEHPGTFTVVVEKPGYERWVREGVVVRAGECHVITRKLEARLAPAGGL